MSFGCSAALAASTTHPSAHSGHANRRKTAHEARTGTCNHTDGDSATGKTVTPTVQLRMDLHPLLRTKCGMARDSWGERERRSGEYVGSSPLH